MKQTFWLMTRTTRKESKGPKSPPRKKQTQFHVRKCRGGTQGGGGFYRKKHPQWVDQSGSSFRGDVYQPPPLMAMGPQYQQRFPVSLHNTITNQESWDLASPVEDTATWLPVVGLKNTCILCTILCISLW